MLTKYSGYDSNGNQIEKTNVNGSVKTITSGTDSDGNAYTSNDGVKSETETDDFGRTTKVKTTLSNGGTAFYTEYEYADGKDENSTTNLTSKVTQTYGDDNIVTFEYSYDANGNITQIKQDGTVTAEYTYDSLNQLKEEYDYVRLEYVNYSYDNSGNVIAQHTQRIDPTYKCTTGNEYGNVFYYKDSEWKDKLTAVNSDKITYDESGNPLSYRDGMTFTWQIGRQLASTTLDDGTTVAYTYNANGMRTCKDVDGTKTYYYYDDNNNLIGMVKGDTTMFFYYDSSSSPVSVSYNGEMYYYIKNLQGDIVKIIDQSGVSWVTYSYDALGNVTEISGEPNLRALNPLRYRGYVYDDETGLYYLQTRYYDPETGRFLNADDTQYIMFPSLMANLYTYCDNNAISNTDANGNTAWLWMLGLYAVKKSMTLQFYFHSMLNRQRYKCYDFSDNSMYADRILRSTAYYKFKKKYHIINLNTALERMYHQNRLYMSYRGTFDPYSTNERDLYLSIGQCEISISYVIYGNINKRHDIAYSMTVTFTDDYNFEHWTKSKKNSLTMYINNILGYYPQSLGLIVPYSWRIQYKFSGTFRCRH